MAISTPLILSVLALCACPLSAVLSRSIANAVEVLSDSGYNSMSLILELTAEMMLKDSPNVTIFSPSDANFIRSGQPALSLLKYHFASSKHTPDELQSLNVGNEIRTLLPNRTLIVTTSAHDDLIEINNVKINLSMIYEDQDLIIYATDGFFDPTIEIDIHDSRTTDACLALDLQRSATDSFAEASDILKSRGYVVMASFLAAQLIELQDWSKISVFAPVDDVLTKQGQTLTESMSILMQHVTPCRLSWSELVQLKEGTLLRTFAKGFDMNVTRSGDTLLLNGVQVVFPDMYDGRMLVIHGLQQVIPPSPVPDVAAGSLPDTAIDLG